VELENQTSVRREDSKKPSSSEPDPHECSSEDLSTSILTPSTLDDWTDVGGQGRFPAMNHLENLQKTDRYNLELCESLAVDLLDTIYIMRPTASPSQPSDDSDGRVLLRHACKVLKEEKTARSHNINIAHINESDVSPPEKENDFKPISFPVIDAMNSEITDRDIATLVFEWTTIDKFNGFNRVR
jgi:hypothetical protein